MTLKYESEDWQQLVVRLREIAKEQGITQDIIALRTGMKQHSISRIFSLNFSPKISTLVSIAKALKVEIVVQEHIKTDQDESK